MPVVIETNVLATANLYATHASPECVANCIRELQAIRTAETVLIDDAQRIFDEYRRYASAKGQPGPGDAFFKWLWQNQANPERCRRISITPRVDAPDEFEEFPDDPELQRFDRSDRKWVAVAIASRLAPSVVNATDTDWWQHRDALSRHGVHVKFLCPDLM